MSLITFISYYSTKSLFFCRAASLSLKPKVFIVVSLWVYLHGLWVPESNEMILENPLIELHNQFHYANDNFSIVISCVTECFCLGQSWNCNVRCFCWCSQEAKLKFKETELEGNITAAVSVNHWNPENREIDATNAVTVKKGRQ